MRILSIIMLIYTNTKFALWSKDPRQNTELLQNLQKSNVLGTVSHFILTRHREFIVCVIVFRVSPYSFEKLFKTLVKYPQLKSKICFCDAMLLRTLQ